MVEACTDHDPAHDRPSWEMRKAAHVARLWDADEACLRILLADAVCNVRELQHGLAEEGNRVWDRYSAGTRVADHLHALADVFSDRLGGPLAAELERAVDALQQEAGAVPA
ncbi:MAG TPA: hypothetical protein VMM13_19550 [Euzebya sp.]|nr:hypothetical protein [Euzebya sp.]